MVNASKRSMSNTPDVAHGRPEQLRVLQLGRRRRAGRRLSHRRWRSGRDASSPSPAASGRRRRSRRRRSACWPGGRRRASSRPYSPPPRRLATASMPPRSIQTAIGDGEGRRDRHVEAAVAVQQHRDVARWPPVRAGGSGTSGPGCRRPTWRRPVRSRSRRDRYGAVEACSCVVSPVRRSCDHSAPDSVNEVDPEVDDVAVRRPAIPAAS